MDFSLRTQNVKINFMIHADENATSRNRPTTRCTSSRKYSLNVFKLKPVPASIRNARHFNVAEIPPRYLFEVQEAEFVGLYQEEEEDEEDNNRNASVIATVPANVIAEDEDSSFRTFSNYDECLDIPPPLVAAEVAALPGFIHQEEQQQSCSSSNSSSSTFGRTRIAFTNETEIIALPVVATTEESPVLCQVNIVNSDHDDAYSWNRDNDFSNS
jgi:hypothetical protein